MPLQGELEVAGGNYTTKTGFASSDIGNFVRQIEAFRKCIEEDTEPSASGEDGLEMTRLTAAILESSKEGKAVKIRRN